MKQAVVIAIINMYCKERAKAIHKNVLHWYFHDTLLLAWKTRLNLPQDRGSSSIVVRDNPLCDFIWVFVV